METLKHIFTDFWKQSNWLDRLIVLAFLLSVTWLKFAPLVLAITFVWSLFQRRNFQEIKKQLFNLRSVALWSMAFFLYHIVGMAWSTNSAFGWSDVGMKASFILLPILFSIGRFSLRPNQFVPIVSVLFIGIIIGLLLNAAWKSWYYPEDNHWAYFFESEYSYFIHRSYWATYTAMAASWMLYAFLSDYTRNRVVYFTCWIFLSVSTFLTISKAGIIIWILLSFAVFVQFVIRKRWWKLLGSGVLVSVLFVVFLFVSDSRIASRFQEIPKAISTVETENNPSTESNTARIIMWSTSVKVIRENWLLGTGTGDVKDALLAKNQSLNNTGAAEKNLNSHNQFLNTWTQLGIIGFTTLLLLFFWTFKNAFQKRNAYGVLFGATLFITMLFESFVETQAGIVPFCILLMLLNHFPERDSNPA